MSRSSRDVGGKKAAVGGCLNCVKTSSVHRRGDAVFHPALPSVADAVLEIALYAMVAAARRR